MSDRSIERLRVQLGRQYGGRLKPYGWSPAEVHGFGFVVEGIPAIFSVITRDGSMPADRFDVQIESLPPGEYLYASEVNLDELLQLVPVFTGPPSKWPENPAGGK